MKIIQLTAENIKRLQAVQITPKGNVVTISGKNGHGKTSCLDAITYALGGDPSDRMPVRRGEEKAKVVVDLGDIIVKRTFTAAGGTALVVTNADGVKQTTPQAILDKLVGKLTFDPLAFSREKPKQQADILRGLVGLDFAEHDKKREGLYEQRTGVNRNAKSLQIRLEAMPKHDVPDSEIAGGEILSEQRAAAESNAENSRLRSLAQATANQARLAEIDLREADKVVVSLTQELLKAEAVVTKRQAACKEASRLAKEAFDKAAGLLDKDLTPFAAKLKEVETTNAKIRDNRRRAEMVTEFKDASERAEKLTQQIEAMDAAKRKATTEAKYPVEGLLFDTAGGVTLNGIPFEQCSAAEQLKVSVAIGLALNPTLRVLLIRDASLLDEESLKAVGEMADKADAQVWLEVVSSNVESAIVIEDGKVRDEQPAEPKLL